MLRCFYEEFRGIAARPQRKGCIIPCSAGRYQCAVQSYDDVCSARKECTVSMAGNGGKKAGFENASDTGTGSFLVGDDGVRGRLWRGVQALFPVFLLSRTDPCRTVRSPPARKKPFNSGLSFFVFLWRSVGESLFSDGVVSCHNSIFDSRLLSAHFSFALLLEWIHSPGRVRIPVYFLNSKWLKAYSVRICISEKNGKLRMQQVDFSHLVKLLIC